MNTLSTSITQIPAIVLNIRPSSRNVLRYIPAYTDRMPTAEDFSSPETGSRKNSNAIPSGPLSSNRLAESTRIEIQQKQGIQTYAKYMDFVRSDKTKTRFDLLI